MTIGLSAIPDPGQDLQRMRGTQVIAPEVSGKGVVIIGYEMVTPLGCEPAAHWDAFAAGKSGVDWIQRFDVTESYPVRVSGEVAKIDFSKHAFWNERDAAHWFSPVIFRSMRVAERGLAHAGFKVTEENAARTAVTFRASSETLNEKIPLVLPVGHGGSCLDHGALGKNAIIPAQWVRHLPTEL